MVNVVFDMDGVLFDTQRIYYKTWFVVADRLGLPDITEPADKCIGTNRKYQYSVLYDFMGRIFHVKNSMPLRISYLPNMLNRTVFLLRKEPSSCLSILKTAAKKWQ